MKKSKISLFFINLPLFLAVVLYLLIYWVRYQQGGWEIEIDLFGDQRQALDQKISQHLPSPQAQLLSGIILGEKKDLPYDFRLALRDTSTLHIVVVSGQNLTLLAGFILSLSGLIKRRLAISMSFIAIILYTLLTGAQVPVLRAAIMVSFTFLAQITGRQKDSLYILILTASLMLLVNPLWLTDLSFQLSFMATLGVVSVSPILLYYFKNLPLIGQDLATTIGAQLMVMPIIAQNFHQLSLVGVITNLLVLWTIPLIMILGAVFLLVSLVSNFLAQGLAIILEILLTYFVYIVEFFASAPFAWEYVGEQPWIFWVGYYMLLLSVMLSLSYGQKENS